MARRTEQREAIERVFRRIHRPLTANEVLDAAREEVPGLGMATVYRNLGRLVDRGGLAVVELPGQPARYERPDLDDHHHFQCEDCGRVFDVHTHFSGIENAAPDGFSVKSAAVTFYGSCADCTTN